MAHTSGAAPSRVAFLALRVWSEDNLSIEDQGHRMLFRPVALLLAAIRVMPSLESIYFSFSTGVVALPSNPYALHSYYIETAQSQHHVVFTDTSSQANSVLTSRKEDLRVCVCLRRRRLVREQPKLYFVSLEGRCRYRGLNCSSISCTRLGPFTVDNVSGDG